MSVSRFSIAVVFAAGTIYLLSAPREPFYKWQLIFLVGLTFLSAAFPLSWVFFPQKRPVYRALAAHGDARSTADRLDAEMAQAHEVEGPFHFTATMLVYSPGYTLDVVPYDTISFTHKKTSVGETGGAVIVVQTKHGRTYEWHRKWVQGIFEPDKVLLNIRERANLTRQ